ncbi:MAG: lactate racemase domain-containing protein [Actinomycetota bacterium]
MEQSIVFGDRFIPVSLPDETKVLSAGLTTRLEPIADLESALIEALDHPVDTPPLRELARGRSRVTIAFDDPTVPCFAPVWSTAIPLVLQRLEEAGVKRENVTLVCANALHRKFTHDELEGILGAGLVREFADRLVCHDAEAPEEIEKLGVTPNGYNVELSTHVTNSDLTIYVNASTIRGFSGGWKSICVGLSTYNSIKHHHNPDDMSMSLHRNRMHEMLNEMGALVTATLGADRIFKIETILSNPLQVSAFTAGTIDGTRSVALGANSSAMDRRASSEKYDVIVYGLPDWSPYASYSFTNPLLTLISTGLGYLGGMIEAAGKKDCTVILATPCVNRWDDRAHPSYKEIWDRVLPVTKDPYEARKLYEDEYAHHAHYIERYRFSNGFHPVHGIMALFPLKRLKHAGRVLVAGAEDHSIVSHAGFEPFETVEDAIAEARASKPDATIGLVPYPMAVNRT